MTNTNTIHLNLTHRNVRIPSRFSPENRSPLGEVSTLFKFRLAGSRRLPDLDLDPLSASNFEEIRSQRIVTRFSRRIKTFPAIFMEIHCPPPFRRLVYPVSIHGQILSGRGIDVICIPAAGRQRKVRDLHAIKHIERIGAEPADPAPSILSGEPHTRSRIHARALRQGAFTIFRAAFLRPAFLQPTIHRTQIPARAARSPRNSVPLDILVNPPGRASVRETTMDNRGGPVKWEISTGGRARELLFNRDPDHDGSSDVCLPGDRSCDVDFTAPTMGSCGCSIFDRGAWFCILSWSVVSFSMAPHGFGIILDGFVVGSLCV